MPSGRGSTREAVDDLIGLLVPAGDRSRLLRCCVCPADEVAVSWRAWTATVGDVKAAFGGDYQRQNWMVPLLHHRLGDAGVDVDAGTRAFMRAASHREALRTATFGEVVDDVLARLDAERGEFALLGDVAVAETAYHDWSRRHCSSIELHCSRDVAQRIVSRLGSAGVAREPGPRPVRHASAHLRHLSGVPVVVGWNAVPSRHDPAAGGRLMSLRQTRSVVGHDVHLVDPTALLFTTLIGAATRPQRDTLAWAIDASFIVATRTVDADVFASLVTESGLTRPVRGLCAYLASTLGVPMRAAVSELPDPSEAELSAADRDALLWAVQQSGDVDARTLVRHSSPVRTMVLGSLLRPAPGHLAARYDASARWRLPFVYLLRLLAPIRGADM